MDILFIGNSYTGNLMLPFCRMMKEVRPEATLQFKMAGGWTLARHVADPAVKEAIMERRWDRVVLQEQSRTPTYSTGCKAYGAHREAIRTLVEWIREQGATPILYETWGRRDGDGGSPKRSPDFDAMQAHLSRAYREAGFEVQAQVVPVGQVWQAVRRANPVLGRGLYAPDGSHASVQGSYLIGATFLRTLIGLDAATLKRPPPMTPEEAAVVHTAVRVVVGT